jgi:hypothetical protein
MSIAIPPSGFVTWIDPAKRRNSSPRATNVAPAYYVVVTAMVAVLLVVTIRENAGRPPPQGGPD